jgi:N-acetylneuraminic acid mutarotase
MYCDLADGRCKNGCASDSGCRTNESCDLTRHACACASNAHDCGGVCSSNASPDSCGTSCTPCALPADPNALATTCTSGTCGFACKPGFAVFGSGCISVGSWSTGPTIPTARVYFAAVGGLDGRIYVLGGQNASTPSAVVEAYTPSTNSWKTLASMPTARTLLWAVAVGTTASDFAIYALGGSASGGITPALSTVEKYDPATNTWSAAPSMPMALASFWATTATDAAGATSIYTHGGANTSGAMFAFSTSQQRWTTVLGAAGIPPAPNAGFVGVQDTIYLLSGTTYAYKPATNAWSTVASILSGVDYPGAVAKDGRVYVLGGQNPGNVATAEMYLPDLNKWASLTSMPMALGGPIAATGGDGRIYVFASGPPSGAGSLVFTP